jgi:hypothetical protein
VPENGKESSNSARASGMNEWIDTILDINYFNKSIANIPYTIFLCSVTDDTLTCDNHTDQLISTMNSARYTITAVKAMCQGKL